MDFLVKVETTSWGLKAIDEEDLKKLIQRINKQLD
jgi:BRCT domain type II-containing protein